MIEESEKELPNSPVESSLIFLPVLGAGERSLVSFPSKDPEVWPEMSES
jgi:hypothetical protein